MTLSRRSAGVLLTLIVLGGAASSIWMATGLLNSSRVWDERWSLNNVRGILRTGSLVPVKPWYPSLSHLPGTAVMAASQALHQATGNEVFAILRPNGSFTRTAYLLGRCLSALYGAGTLFLTFVVGRRLFSAEVGVLSALLLAVSQSFLYAASIFKPDILLMLFSLAVFLWSLEAAERGTLRSYLWAGAGVGLAAAAKQNGALTAIPLVVATAMNARQRSRWLWLPAAGVASVVVFLLLNPFPEATLHYLKMGERFATWAAHNQQELPPTLIYAVLLPLSRLWHGAVVGTASLLGLAGLTVEFVRRRRQGAAAAPLAIFVSYPILFSLVCAAVSSLPKDNAFIPLLPFSAIAAAWSLNKAWQWIAGRLPAARRRLVFWPALIALLFVVGRPAGAYIYSEAIRTTTLTEARRLILQAAPTPSQRSIFYEKSLGAFRQSRKFTAPSGILMLAEKESGLDDVPESRLDLADYEIFPEARLHSDGRDFYLRRLSRQQSSAWMVEPEPLRIRGPAVMILGHPWTVAETHLPIEWSAAPDERRRKLRAALPEHLARGDVVSFDLVLSRVQARDCTLLYGESELAFFAYHFEHKRVTHMTRRFVLQRPGKALRIECLDVQSLDERPSVAIWKWLPPAG